MQKVESGLTIRVMGPLCIVSLEPPLVTLCVVSCGHAAVLASGTELHEDELKDRCSSSQSTNSHYYETGYAM